LNPSETDPENLLKIPDIAKHRRYIDILRRKCYYIIAMKIKSMKFGAVPE
jgi:hypothetical protein